MMEKPPYSSHPTNHEELFNRLEEILNGGWFDTRDQDADGKVGNTLEDLLGVKENNFSLPDVGEYELKTKRRRTGSLTSLFHLEPSPRQNYPGCTRKCSPVQGFLVPEFGWQHQKKEDENSFRVTLSGEDWHPRGFRINVDRTDDRVYIEYNKDKIDFNRIEVGSIKDWYKNLPSEIPQKIYWEFEDLEKKKLANMIFVYADARGEGNDEEFNYTEAEVWEEFSSDKFINEIQNGGVKIDFDASTNHNHGVKFRINKGKATMEELYSQKDKLN